MLKSLIAGAAALTLAIGAAPSSADADGRYKRSGFYFGGPVKIIGGDGRVHRSDRRGYRLPPRRYGHGPYAIAPRHRGDIFRYGGGRIERLERQRRELRRERREIERERERLEAARRELREDRRRAARRAAERRAEERRRARLDAMPVRDRFRQARREGERYDGDRRRRLAAELERRRIHVDVTGYNVNRDR